MKNSRFCLVFIHQGVLRNLAEAHKYGGRRKQVIELYWNSRDELTIEDGSVYKGKEWS